MKRSIKDLQGFSLKETDGELGKVVEFYFDDYSWTIRYLVVETGSWLSKRKVLISPKALQKPDWGDREFPVNLTKDQIENSPDIDTDKPVSRQQEEDLSSYYPWGIYWGNEPDEHGAGIFGMMPSALAAEVFRENVVEQPVHDTSNNDPHLRSTKAIIGYNIHATDGEIGTVVDYLIDDSNWKIIFLVVETGSFLDSRKIVLSVQWIKELNWENSNVVVNLTTNSIKDSPEFDDSEPINEAYEKSLYDYYGKEQKS